MTTKTVQALTAWERNPRKITPSRLRILAKGLQKYGDLGGIVFNVQLQRLASGHQRATTFNKSNPVTITERFNPPTEQGTTALGYIEENGERFSYREVAWNEEDHAAAALLANEAGGEWDFPELKNILSELDTGSFDMEHTGFEIHEIENLFGSDGPAADPNKKLDYSALNGESVDGKMQDMADGVRKALQIEFQPEHYEEASQLVKFWRDRGAYLGLMLINHLRVEKEKLDPEANMGK